MLRRMKFDGSNVLVEHMLDGVPQPLLIRNHSWPEHSLTTGPGTELKALLLKLGLKPAANCKCNQRIAYMNEKGIVWCEQNIDTIVGWLKEEATRAKLPFVEIGARMVVKHVIRHARRKA